MINDNARSRLRAVVSAAFVNSLWIRLAICVLFMAKVVLAQQTSGKKNDIESMFEDKITTPTVQPSGVAFESVVDPAKYFVGPSDVIAVNIWISPPLNLFLTVTPEGTLIIPMVGEVAVANQTLAEAKRTIIEQVRKKYLTADVTATLSKPRPIVVSVTGTVLNPGLYTLSAIDRVNKAIDEANKLAKLQTPENFLLIKKMMSARNVVLKHRDGTQQRVDLPKFFATQEDQWDPYLREGDVVVVPRKDQLKNVFGVYGQVNAPGRYEFVEGDRVLDAIKIAYGMTSLARADKVLFSRLSPDGATLVSKDINVLAITAGTEPDPVLEPGDRIVVQGQIDAREDYNVDVKGEVRYPGTYPITKHQSHLTDVIRMAGGFTDNASLSSATVVRQSFVEDEIPDEEMISMRGIVSTQDTLGYGLETSLRITRGAVTVDFTKLFAAGDSSQDIIMQAEDQVVIPKLQSTVYVFGQVSSPGHIAYADQKDVRYYVAMSGGFSDRANSGDVRIIKAKTKQWLAPGDTKIEPGDYIWVPANPDHPFSYYMTIASQAASVLSVVIGVAILAVQASK